MKKHDEIMIGLDTLSRKIGILEKLASDKAVKLEQELNRVENQKDAFLKQRDAALEELEELRTENEKLKRELHALEGRLRQQLQEGDALMAPNNHAISFPKDDGFKFTHLDGGYYLISRDGLDLASADGKVLKVR
jgi:regulator of replication initiation timing